MARISMSFWGFLSSGVQGQNSFSVPMIALVNEADSGFRIFSVWLASKIYSALRMDRQN